MAISEKKVVIPLSIEKCEAFKPKKEKGKENCLKFPKYQLDLNLIEEEENLLKLKDIPRRKSSDCSTSVSKPEDTSEILSFPNSPIASPKSEKKGIFFGRDRNCSNPIFNFYQNTEENIREKYSENENYKNTKNYILKKDFYKSNDFSEIKKNDNNSISSNKIENSTKNNNIFNNNSPQTTSVAAVMGAFTPKICSGGKGKFDLPMYYMGFYGWDSKYKINNFKIFQKYSISWNSNNTFFQKRFKSKN